MGFASIIYSFEYGKSVCSTLKLHKRNATLSSCLIQAFQARIKQDQLFPLSRAERVIAFVWSKVVLHASCL